VACGDWGALESGDYESSIGGAAVSGFARWAAAHWSDDEFDAATILSRTWLIAIGRQYAIDRVAGQPVTRNQEMIGRCFAYDPVRASDTVFVAGSIRDSRAGEQTAREVEP